MILFFWYIVIGIGIGIGIDIDIDLYTIYLLPNSSLILISCRKSPKFYGGGQERGWRAGMDIDRYIIDR